MNINQYGNDGQTCFYLSTTICKFGIILLWLISSESSVTQLKWTSPVRPSRKLNCDDEHLEKADLPLIITEKFNGNLLFWPLANFPQ